jgi:hypothetical protein
LFPYPTKEDATKTAYTAYCGITGYRLFPKNKSMMPDSIGTKDYIAVVVSKEELPWYELNQNISTPGSNYASNVSNALRSYGSASLQVSSTGNGNLRFTAAAGAKSVSYAIVEINKK